MTVTVRIALTFLLHFFCQEKKWKRLNKKGFQGRREEDQSYSSNVFLCELIESRRVPFTFPKCETPLRRLVGKGIKREGISQRNAKAIRYYLHAICY